jgi:hypothetical protein
MLSDSHADLIATSDAHQLVHGPKVISAAVHSRRAATMQAWTRTIDKVAMLTPVAPRNRIAMWRGG